jgi:hypothetical protein
VPARLANVLTVTTEAKMSAAEALDVEKGASTAVAKEDETPQEEIQYPGWRKLALIMIALYLSMFLVALVRHASPRDVIFLLIRNRTAQLLEQQFPKLQMIFIVSTMSGGMLVHISSRCVLSSSCMAAYTPSIVQNG